MANKNEEQAAQDAPKKSKLPLLIIIVVVLAGGGAGAFFLLGTKGKAEVKKVDKNKMGPVVTMDTFIVNLNEPGATRYLKIGVELEMHEALLKERLPLRVRLRDRILVYLSGLRIAEIQKKGSKKAMKHQMLAFSNEIFGKDSVKAVYFKSFVMQ